MKIIRSGVPIVLITTTISLSSRMLKSTMVTEDHFMISDISSMLNLKTIL